MVGALLSVALAGCSGGGDGDTAEPAPPRDSAEPAPVTTAAGRPEIDLSQPIPGGSLHGTPRPRLKNKGDDYVAIFESLTAGFRWVTENPDLTVISEIFAPGTPPHDARVDAYSFLISNGYRWADEGYQLLSVEVISTQPSVVSLRVVDELQFEKVVDSAGQQVGDIRTHAGPTTATVVLARGTDGRWRIADTSSSDSSVVEV